MPRDLKPLNETMTLGVLAHLCVNSVCVCVCVCVTPVRTYSSLPQAALGETEEGMGCGETVTLNCRHRPRMETSSSFSLSSSCPLDTENLCLPHCYKPWKVTRLPWSFVQKALKNNPFMKLKTRNWKEKKEKEKGGKKTHPNLGVSLAQIEVLSLVSLFFSW